MTTLPLTKCSNTGLRRRVKYASNGAMSRFVSWCLNSVVVAAGTIGLACGGDDRNAEPVDFGGMVSGGDTPGEEPGRDDGGGGTATAGSGQVRVERVVDQACPTVIPANSGDCAACAICHFQCASGCPSGLAFCAAEWSGWSVQRYLCGAQCA